MKTTNETLEGFLVRLDKVTPEQINEARAFQKNAPDQMLMDALVHTGILDQDAANRLLIAYRAKAHPSRANVNRAYKLATAPNRRISALHQALAGMIQ